MLDVEGVYELNGSYDVVNVIVGEEFDFGIGFIDVFIAN